MNQYCDTCPQHLPAIHDQLGHSLRQFLVFQRLRESGKEPEQHWTPEQVAVVPMIKQQRFI